MDSRKIYLDTSVYNRPFDNQTQPRIWLESLAFSVILELIKTQELTLVTSSVLAFENSKNPFPERREWVQVCLRFGAQRISLNERIRERSLELRSQGLHAIDALHLACAETAQAAYFLTCDDKVVKRYCRTGMIVCNPIAFILTMTEDI